MAARMAQPITADAGYKPLTVMWHARFAARTDTQAYPRRAAGLLGHEFQTASARATSSQLRVVPPYQAGAVAMGGLGCFVIDVSRGFRCITICIQKSAAGGREAAPIRARK
jgi:hypothetical protein